MVKKRLPAVLAGFLAEHICKSRRSYRKRLTRCRKDFTEKAVHKLRIEMRRMLALLSLLEDLGCQEGVRKLRKSLKQKLDAFDGLRNTHVQLALLKPFWSDFPEARAFKKLLQSREKKFTSKLSRRLQKTRSARLMHRLKKLEKSLRSPKCLSEREMSANLARAALTRSFGRVAALRRQVRHNDPATIHHMRIAFKQHRYMAELLDPVFAAFTPLQLEQMKEFQSLAGTVQDWHVLLGTLDDAVKCKDLTRAEVKKLRSEVSRRRQIAIDSFMTRIDDFRDFHPHPFRRAATG